MDTFCEISCYSSDKDKAVIAIDAAFKEMERIERVFSKFDENSEVSKINKRAGLEKTDVSEEVFDLIERSLYYSRISEGAFDITAAPFMDIWGFVSKHNSIPDKDVINNALECVGYKKIEMNPGNLSVRFLNKGTKIDFGGIAKGYAVDRAKDIMVSKGIKNCLVNLGGNMYALGNPPGKKAWRIGIQDPENKGKALKILELKNQAVSTSGSYERFVELGGKRYCHIINPLTGEPVQRALSVTVTADSAEGADALSTAIFVMGEEKGLALAKAIKNIQVLIFKEDGKIMLYP